MKGVNHSQATLRASHPGKPAPRPRGVFQQTVKLTAHFERNLEAIESFLAEAGALPAYDSLLEELLDTLIPNLEQFPAIGREFLKRPAGSVEAVNALERLQTKLQGGGLREYLLADYLVLYARFDTEIYLLAIKHHRQLSFDFQSWYWERPV